MQFSPFYSSMKCFVVNAITYKCEICNIDLIIIRCKTHMLKKMSFLSSHLLSNNANLQIFSLNGKFLTR